MRRRDFLLGCTCVSCTGLALPGYAALPADLVEPHMHFVPEGSAPQVAVTFDACMGDVDMRILSALITDKIAATIFATRRWLDHNPGIVGLLHTHRDLFVVQNHGAQHLPCVIGTEKPYGLTPAGTPDGVFAEVMGGQQAITAAFGTAPKWFRDAAAVYTHDALGLIGTMGFAIGGFSLNGDLGASVSAGIAQSRLAAAKSGDVIISHINQPLRPAGAGVVAGLLALKGRGFSFVHLDDVKMVALV
jgi:peptidoglycan/xylan/chitin deacetylase (PgdA/CDA1 family)